VDNHFVDVFCAETLRLQRHPGVRRVAVVIDIHGGYLPLVETGKVLTYQQYPLLPVQPVLFAIGYSAAVVVTHPELLVTPTADMGQQPVHRHGAAEHVALWQFVWSVLGHGLMLGGVPDGSRRWIVAL